MLRISAIAYSEETGAYGYSWGYANLNDAKNRALEECESRSNVEDCTVATWFKNACGALADTSEGDWGGDWGEDLVAAEHNAMNSCSEYSDDCRIRISVCADGYPYK